MSHPSDTKADQGVGSGCPVPCTEILDQEVGNGARLRCCLRLQLCERQVEPKTQRDMAVDTILME